MTPDHIVVRSGWYVCRDKARGGSQMSGDAGALSARLRH